jgi:hypothetical protein
MAFWEQTCRPGLIVGPSLRTVGAFHGFADSKKSYNASDADGVPDEFVPGSFDGRTAGTARARSARALRIGVGA